MQWIKFFTITKKKLLVCCLVFFFAGKLLAFGISQPNNSLNKLIVIDAGHGGIDDGTSSNQVKEKEINLKIAKYLTDYLSKGSLKVIMTRKDDSLYQDSRRKDIIQRAKMANQRNADLFISIHVNSFPGTSSFGGQSFYTPDCEESKQLAGFIQEELINIQPENYRQIKPGPFYVLQHTEMPAVLVEVGFLSNPQDFQRLTNEEELKRIAKAIETGVTNYLNKKLEQQSTKNEVPASSLGSNRRELEPTLDPPRP